MSDPQNYHEQFVENGCVLLEGGISDEILEHLREAAETLFKGVAEGKWTTRHQTVLKPDVFHPAYLEFLNIPEMAAVGEAVLETKDLVTSGLACLLGSPKNEICKWHRDFPDTHPEMEELLRHPSVVIQINAAIFDDQSLWIIPSSHSRTTLPNEDAYEKRFSDLKFIGPTETAHALDENIMSGMPGSSNVQLQAGDILMYNPFLWHAAEYRPDWKRATLHGGLKKAENIDKYVACRWGLEHNPWFKEPEYMGDLGEIFAGQLARHVACSNKYPKGPLKAY